MCGVYNPLTADCFLRPAIVCNDHRLVVAEEDGISPFLDKRCNLSRELELPPVERTLLFRKLLLSHLCMGYDDNGDAKWNELIELLEESAELLVEIGIASPVAQTFQACYLELHAYVLDAHSFGPISGIEDERLAAVRGCDDLVNHCIKFRPCLDARYSSCVYLVRSTLCVDKERIWCMGCQCGFPDAFRPRDNDLNGSLLCSVCYIQHM